MSKETVEITLFPDGTKSTETQHKNGVLHGRYLSWYREDGKINRDRYFINGELNGIQKYYYSTSLIRMYALSGFPSYKIEEWWTAKLSISNGIEISFNG